MNQIKNSFKLGLFICLSTLFCTCKTIKLEQSVGIVRVENNSGQIKAGIGRTDITVLPGHSMGGYGKDLAKISQGWWTRLYATANYFEDQNGRIMVILASDLWSVSSVLCDLVIKELHTQADSMYHLARETVLFSATHTHHSQGNFSSTWVYNSESSAEAGFDTELVNFLAKQMAKAIIDAIDNKEPVELSYYKTKVKGLTRNRSLDAFLNNPDKQNMIDEVSNLDVSTLQRPFSCLTQNDTAYLAIDPQLTSIKIKSLLTNNLIGIISVFGGHPTTLGVANPFLSADVFGVSRHSIENHFDGIKMSFLNGAVGDVSFNWLYQNKNTTDSLGQILATQIIDQIQNSSEQSINSDFKTSLTFKKLKDREVEQDKWDEFSEYDFDPIKTDKKATIGMATLEGAEDGRTHGLTIAEECQYDEGRAGPCIGRQGHKRVFFISNFAIKGDPEFLPLGIFSLGDLHLISIPGEPSVGLCYRIKKAVEQQKQGDAIIVSMANEYLSYFTTPSEYVLQHYEGSSTVYGFATGALLEQEFSSLSAVSSFQMQYYKHDPEFGVGAEIKKENAFSKLINETIEIEKIIDSIFVNSKIVDLHTTIELNHNHSDAILPTAEVQLFLNGQWLQLKIQTSISPGLNVDISQSDSESSNFLTYVKAEQDKLNWCVRWMVPDNYRSNLPHRLVFNFPDTSILKTIDQSLLTQ